MISKRMIRLMVAVLVAAMLAGAYVIVAASREKAGPATQQAPSGFMH